MKKLFFATFLVGSFSVNAYSQDTKQYHVLANDFVAAVTQSMKDPSSTQVKNVKVVQKTPNAQPFVCATVNGKNSYGAYTGFKLFHGAPDNPRTKEDYDGVLADIWPRIVEACANGPFVFQGDVAPQSFEAVNLPSEIVKKLEAYATLNNIDGSDAAALEILSKYFSK